MTTFLFWLAIPLGFTGLPVAAFGIVLLPFAVVSLFNEFSAPREVLWNLFGIYIVTFVPFFRWLLGTIWQTIDPTEDSPKRASLLGAKVFTAAFSLAYLDGWGLIGTSNSSWLLTSYWFICLTQLWSATFLLTFAWLARKN
jgi:hypothetical protein